MTYLLDVNALIALGFAQHEFHDRMASWVKTQQSESLSLATCSITELGFVRVLAQAPAYGLTVTEARNVLVRLKSVTPLSLQFIPDTLDIRRLPAWVKTAKQITDGHLLQLAQSNGIVLATLDKRIPGAFIIPHRRVR